MGVALMGFLEMSDLEKKRAILAAMEGEDRTTVARIAVRLDEPSYRLSEARISHARYDDVKNQVRLMLNMLLRDGRVCRSDERAWYGHYYWWLPK